MPNLYTPELSRKEQALSKAKTVKPDEFDMLGAQALFDRAKICHAEGFHVAGSRLFLQAVRVKKLQSRRGQRHE